MSDDQATAVPLSRTLLLWLAALAVTWVSGIEPTWRKVQDVAAQFEEINLQRHEADRKAIALQQRFDSQRAERAELSEFEDAYPRGEKRTKARAKLFAELVKAQADVNKGNDVLHDWAHAVDLAKPCASAILSATAPSPRGNNKAEKNLASTIDRLRNFCEAERRIEHFGIDQQTDRLNAQSVLLAGEKRHQDELAAARTHADDVRSKSNVDFELLGVKFTAEPLLASLLWSSFAFAWLVAARQETIRAGAPPPPEGEKGQFQHASAMRLLTLLTLLAWTMQLRVAWLGLGITALTGDMTWKALVAITVCLLFLGSGVLVATIFANRPFLAPKPTRTRSAHLLVTSAVLVLIAVFATVWWMPSQALRLAHAVMPALPLLGGFPLLLLGLAWWLTRLRHVAKHGSPGRRVFLMGSAAAVAVTLASVVWWRMHPSASPASKYRSALRHPRKPGRSYAASKLAAGFYRNINKHAKNGSVIVVHYISEGGQIAARARLPRTLAPVPRPVYRWLGAFKWSDVSEVRNEAPGVDGGDGKSALPPESEPWNLESYRVALATASWNFEHAALQILSKHAAGRKNVKRACELLLNGIYHDIQYKKFHVNARKRSAPSYRLYDLAAGLAVRFNQPQVLEELKQRIQQDGYRLLFESRIKKWDDVNSAWYRRWRERQVPMRWQANQQVSVF